jgi:hypothetical protein
VSPRQRASLVIALALVGAIVSGLLLGQHHGEARNGRCGPGLWRRPGKRRRHQPRAASPGDPRRDRPRLLPRSPCSSAWARWRRTDLRFASFLGFVVWRRPARGRLLFGIQAFAPPAASSASWPAPSTWCLRPRVSTNGGDDGGQGCKRKGGCWPPGGSWVSRSRPRPGRANRAWRETQRRARSWADGRRATASTPAARRRRLRHRQPSPRQPSPHQLLRERPARPAPSGLAEVTASGDPRRPQKLEVRSDKA